MKKKKQKNKQRIKQVPAPHPADFEILHVARTHITDIVGTLNAISHRVDDIWDHLRAQRKR